MQELQVAVLRGGPSSEHDVSMQTARQVTNALNNLGHRPRDIHITREREWLSGGFARRPEHALHGCDIVFNAMHGAYGEDGTVQRVLDQVGLPYVGSGAFASSLTMNKVLTKDHLKAHDIRQAPHFKVRRDHTANPRKVAGGIADMFGPRFVVKPTFGGSSIGVIVANNAGELAEVLEISLKEHEAVMVEQFITGREATVGVIEGWRGEELYALPPTEVVIPPHTDHFDYNIKYHPETEEICPANFRPEIKRELETIARLVHRSLGLRHYSRSDFIVAGDEIYFLEVNTLPGLTEYSLFPRAFAAVGGSYPELVSHLVRQAYLVDSH